jgi:hypothetical protein
VSERDAIERAKGMLAPHVFGHARLRIDGKVSVMEPIVPAAIAAEMLARALPPVEPEEPTPEMVEAGARAICIDFEMAVGGGPATDENWRAFTDIASIAYLVMRAARPAGGQS